MAKRRRRKAAAGRRRRPVDQAMLANRPEKKCIRNLWAQAAAEFNAKYVDDLIYLSLCGGEGHDLALLAEKKIIQLTETGGIAPESAHRVAAVEYDLNSVAALLHKFPGLKVYDRPFQSLVRGESQLRYPDGNDAEFCRARIINLDLNAPLVALEDGETRFPILDWINKLGVMHTRPRRDWCLCLTLHGEIKWPSATCEEVQEFLRENFQTATDFAQMSRGVLGQKIYDQINSLVTIDFVSLDREEQQKVLMIFVPKKINQLMQSQGWKISTKTNLRYGRATHAPMVTWIIHFEHSPRATRAPMATYIECLRLILEGAGHINSRGLIVHDL